MNRIRPLNVPSMDEVEKRSVMPVTSPFEFPSQRVELKRGMGAPLPPAGGRALSLNGTWELVSDGLTELRTDPTGEWEDAVAYPVPGSVHTALFGAGVIPDPLVGCNDRIAREYSYKVWWAKRKFSYDFSLRQPQLCFDGVCYSAHFYLNGHYLGSHRGMFTRAVFAVEDFLQAENVLVVKIDNAPSLPREYSQDAGYDDGWKFGTVINCVYGWHYASIPSRGIWASVRLEERHGMEVERPFLYTVDAAAGEAGLYLRTKMRGTFRLVIRPLNFPGSEWSAEMPVDTHGDGYLHLRFRIPEARAWWPNGYGEQNLYLAQIALTAEDGETLAFTEQFGLRTVRMLPDTQPVDKNRYLWQMCLNGRKLFMKGTNWCTIDALLRFEPARYERLLTLAKEENLCVLRAWGGGMPESDVFYDLCDKLGLMVFQEWPTAWDSDKTQPQDELRATAIEHTIRLRNRPSLVLWAGGNESSEARSPNMREMLRIAYAYDGTRPFHRTSPCGAGSMHSYITYWFQQGLDASLQLSDTFLGEYGMASASNLESIYKYLPERERSEWDIYGKHNAFVHHTPRFNQFVEWPYGENDITYLTQYLGCFYDDVTMGHFVTGTQLAQATVLRHPIERFRSAYPDSTGICFYKLNDVYPGCSWSTVDYYGEAKLSHYLVKQAFAPVHGCVVTSSVDVGPQTTLPVVLLDDGMRARGSVTLCVYNRALEKCKTISYPIPPIHTETTLLGKLDFYDVDTKGLLFVTVEVVGEDGTLFDATFYWFNFQSDGGCMFRLPEGCAAWSVLDEEHILVRNAGELPLVGVIVDRPGHNDEFLASDGVFWLHSGGSRVVRVSHTQGLRLRAWNCRWED